MVDLTVHYAYGHTFHRFIVLIQNKQVDIGYLTVVNVNDVLFHT